MNRDYLKTVADRDLMIMAVDVNKKPLTRQQRYLIERKLLNSNGPITSSTESVFELNNTQKLNIIRADYSGTMFSFFGKVNLSESNRFFIDSDLKF